MSIHLSTLYMTHLYSQYSSKVDCLYLKKWNVTFIFLHFVQEKKKNETLRANNRNSIGLIVIDLTEVTLNSSTSEFISTISKQVAQVWQAVPDCGQWHSFLDQSWQSKNYCHYNKTFLQIVIYKEAIMKAKTRHHHLWDSF